MYFLGIDGGGTKTKVIIIDEDKKILYESTSGPSSLDTVTEKITLMHIKEALSGFFTKYPNALFSSVFAGLGGVTDQNDINRLAALLKGLKGVSKNTLITAASDMENALCSGLSFNEGLVLIAGTGMVAFGKNQFNQSHKAGGLGYKEGDFGSSYDLGMKAIRATARALDNRFDKTDFTDEIALYLDVTNPSAIAALMDKWHNERTKIAGLAPIVTKHADLGNFYAKQICDDATYELALSVKAVQDTLSLLSPTLVVVGSLGNAEGYFKNQLHKKIKHYIKDITIVSPKVDPAYAAALLALNNSNNPH